MKNEPGHNPARKEGSFRLINPEEWKRRDTFHFFRTYDDPFFNIAAQVDVTGLYRHCKAKERSFSLGMLYYATRAANAVPAFRLRLREGQLVEYDTLHVGTTLLHEDETFSFCYIQMPSSFDEFHAAGRLAFERQKREKKFDPNANMLDLIHYSILPWITFTMVKHARQPGTDDSIPKISIGKGFEEQGRFRIPISVEAHHALMDGIHVAKYFSTLEKMTATLPAG